MTDDQQPVLVIGATGFLGRHVVTALTAGGDQVRCLVRTPAKAQDLATLGAEVVQGDMLDADSVARAVDGARAVIVSVHTISRQSAASTQDDFMDVEAAGLRIVAAACLRHGVSRVVYVTSIGVAEHATSSWLRGRWQTEQALFTSGLDVTVLRPGMIVGRGGDGFGIVARGATRRFALAIGSPRMRFRTVSVDDLARDLVDVMDESSVTGQAFEVGSDDVLTIREMTAIAAESVGRRPGTTVFVPAWLLRILAPALERLARLPRGAISGFVGDAPQADMVGDPAALRAVLHRADRPFRQAIEGQVG